MQPVSGKSQICLCVTLKFVWGPCRALSNEWQVGGMPAAHEEDQGGA